MIDNYIYVIIALLPLTALMLVFQVNPYHALVIRAILGAVAALVYAVLGAADVALTEALVGTMLAITLYVIAVRSSLVMRLGILSKLQTEPESDFAELIVNLRQVINKYHLRLELIEYLTPQALEQALMTKEVHAICTKSEQLASNSDWLQLTLSPTEALGLNVVLPKEALNRTYQTAIRVRRLFEIMQNEPTLSETILTYVALPNMEEKH
ncbi:MAG TPA: DUF4040 domain-containing protein [Xenococcaceae cyanobacterium]